MLNFELVTDVQMLRRRNFEAVTRAILSPDNANPLIDGEFVALSGTASKVDRAGNGVFAYVVWDEKGRYDVQALGKVTVLHGGGGYEADTRVFTAAGLALGAALMTSASVTVDTLTKSGLALYTSGVVIGYVTRMPAYNGGRLRFHETLV